jgi:hypothetical protein
MITKPDGNQPNTLSANVLHMSAGLVAKERPQPPIHWLNISEQTWLVESDAKQYAHDTRVLTATM